MGGCICAKANTRADHEISVSGVSSCSAVDVATAAGGLLPANGAGLLEEILDLRVASAAGALVPVLAEGSSAAVTFRQVPKGECLGRLLQSWSASLVSGFLRKAADGGWDFYDSASLVRAASGEVFSAGSLNPGDATRLKELPAKHQFREVRAFGSDKDMVVVWKIDLARPLESTSGEERLLKIALDLVVFNHSTALDALQGALENAQQHFEDTLQQLLSSPGGCWPGIVQDLGDLLQDKQGSKETKPVLRSSLTDMSQAEAALRQAEADNQPIHQARFLAFLQEPEAGSEIGFRMRQVVDGHPTVPVFQLTEILKEMDEKGIEVACTPESVKGRRVVLSDIDDTLHPAHDAGSIGISGQDVTPMEHGQIYPCIHEVHCALRGDHQDNKVCHPVYLSARPAVLAKKQKPELQLLAQKMALLQKLPRKDLFCSVLPGADDVGGMVENCFGILCQNLPGMQKGMLCSLGKKKIERFYQYARLFPEPSYAFIGDDGQGDFEAARGLLELSRNQGGGAPTLTPTKDELEDLLNRLERAATPASIQGTLGIDVPPGVLGVLAGAVNVVQKTAKALDAQDGYVSMLTKDKDSQPQRQFSKDNTPVFDFVAIKAVKLKTGFLFSEPIRVERERLMQQIYGEKRFFYFKDYSELLQKLREAGWASPKMYTV